MDDHPGKPRTPGRITLDTGNGGVIENTMRLECPPPFRSDTMFDGATAEQSLVDDCKIMPGKRSCDLTVGFRGSPDGIDR